MADVLGMNALPQELIEEIVSRTSPVHACGTLSIVSKKFRLAANADNVWERFLPLDMIISRRTVSDQWRIDYPRKKIDSDTLPAFPTKKDLYLFLSDNPLLLIDDNGGHHTYYLLDKLSGNKCSRIGPGKLINSTGWILAYHVKPCMFRVCRFALLCDAVNLEVEGKISTSLLSPNTNYTAYLLFTYSSKDSCFFGFGTEQPLETWVGIDGHGENRNVYIPNEKDIPAFTGPQYPVRRRDHWYEVELGDYLNKELGFGSTQLQMSLREVKSGMRKCGLKLHGMEIRPKSSKKIN